MKGFFSRSTLCLLTALGLFIALPAAQAEVVWTPLAADLEQTHIDISPSTLFSSQLLLIRTSLSRFRVEVIRAVDFSRQRASVAEMCKASKASLCINANFFDEAGNPLGLIVHRGIKVQDMHRGGKTLTGVFSTSRDSMKIVARAAYQPERVLEAVQAGPRILHARLPVTGIELYARSRRSGVCIDDHNHLIFFIVSSGLLGVSMEELQTALRQANCSEALNLDGGGSSQLYLSKNIPEALPALEEVNIIARDEVPVGLALFPK
ncbi:MAG: phosphodiester glycosidase family protein [Deltaproteobacteria bacterium]|nr:phosphodiester glycosidase family protein [Deltaproteobacteria bacterium]